MISVDGQNMTGPLMELPLQAGAALGLALAEHFGYRCERASRWHGHPTRDVHGQGLPHSLRSGQALSLPKGWPCQASGCGSAGLRSTLGAGGAPPGQNQPRGPHSPTSVIGRTETEEESTSPAEGRWITINRAAPTRPYRLSTVSGERMNQMLCRKIFNDPMSRGTDSSKARWPDPIRGNSGCVYNGRLVWLICNKGIYS